MPALIPYIIKLSISLAVIYGFYQLVLRRLTFYNWNRWYLLLYSMLCFVLPVINVFNILQERGLENAAIINYIPSVSQFGTARQEHIHNGSILFTWQTLYFIVLLAGALVMLMRLFIQYRSLLKIRSGAVLLYDNGVKLYHVDKRVVPFSFGKSIYINQEMHGEEELKEIIRHEFIHVKQRHSVDMLWSEILCMLNWYNPFAWLTRKAIRQNLEFIADNQVLKTGLDRKQYQYLLLKTTGVSTFHIATNFNLSSLKKRIVMMNKVKSARVHIVRFLFVLPVLAVIILAFRGAAQNNYLKTHLQVTDTIPEKNKVSDDEFSGPLASPVPDVAPAHAPHHKLAAPHPDLYNDFNDCINSKGYCITIADNRGECVVIVKDKNKKIIEAVALTDWNKDKKYEEKYGEIPPPPPPKPLVDRLPAPVAVPDDVIPPVKALSPHAKPLPPSDMRPMKDIPMKPIPPAPAKLPKGVSTIEINDKKATVIMKDGTTEEYDLNKPDERARFEKKFGTPVAAPDKGDAAVILSDDDNIVAASTYQVTELDLYIDIHTIAVIDKSTTAEQLETIKNDLKKQGYTFTIKNTSFSGGRLAHIDGSVTDGKGHASQFSATGFDKINISVTQKQGGGVSFVVNIIENHKQQS